MHARFLESCLSEGGQLCGCKGRVALDGCLEVRRYAQAIPVRVGQSQRDARHRCPAARVCAWEFAPAVQPRLALLSLQDIPHVPVIVLTRCCCQRQGASPDRLQAKVATILPLDATARPH